MPDKVKDLSTPRVEGPVKKRPRKEFDMMRVLQDPILLPDAKAIWFKPHWEPHDSTKDSDGREASYFWFFEELYDTNPLWAPIPQAYRDLILYQGFRWVSENPEHTKRWEDWWQAANAERLVGIAVLEAVKTGTGALVLIRAEPTVTGIRLQDIPSRGIWPIEEDGRYARVVFVWPDRNSKTDVSMKQYIENGQPIEFSELFFLRINRTAGAFFGRPPSYQSMNLANAVLELLMILSTMARRSTHGILHAKVDVSELDDEPRTDPDTGDPIMSEQEERIWHVQTALDKRVVYDPVTKSTEIMSNLVTGKDVELESIKIENDIAGVNGSIDQGIRVLDRAWRLPRVLQGEGESSNRANSVVQQRQQNSIFREWWENVAEEFTDKVIPAIGIPKESGHFEPINELTADDEEVRAIVLGAVGALSQQFIITREEARKEIDPMLKNVDLDLEEPVEDVIEPEDTEPEPGTGEETAEE